MHPPTNKQQRDDTILLKIPNLRDASINADGPPQPGVRRAIETRNQNVPVNLVAELEGET